MTTHRPLLSVTQAEAQVCSFLACCADAGQCFNRSGYIMILKYRGQLPTMTKWPISSVSRHGPLPCQSHASWEITIKCDCLWGVCVNSDRGMFSAYYAHSLRETTSNCIHMYKTSPCNEVLVSKLCPTAHSPQSSSVSSISEAWAFQTRKANQITPAQCKLLATGLGVEKVMLNTNMKQWILQNSFGYHSKNLRSTFVMRQNWNVKAGMRFLSPWKEHTSYFKINL